METSENPLKSPLWEWIDNVTKLLPFVTLGVIFLGLVSLNIYYSYFGVSIFEYITVSEVIGRSVYLLLSFAAAFIAGILLYMMHRFFKKRKWSLLSVIILSVTILSRLIINTNIPLYFNLELVIFFVVMILFLFLLIPIDEKENISFKQFSVVALVITGVVFVLSSFVLPFLKAWYFKSHTELHNTYVEFNESNPIKMNDKEYVIGMTENYLITFDEVIEKPSVYNRGDIRKLIPGVLPLSKDMFWDIKGPRFPRRPNIHPPR